MRATTRHLVLTGAGLVGAATAATSSVSLYALAELCGIPPILSAALPIALDAGAGVAALVWITEQGERRAWGRGIAIAALVASLGGNGVQHAIVSGLLPVTLLLVLLVGGCIPATLWAVVHLAALMVRSETPVKSQVERAPRKATVKPQRVAPTAESEKRPSAPPPSVASLVRLDKPLRSAQAPPTTKEQRVAWVQSQPEWPSVKTVMDQFRLSQSAAGRVLVAAKRAS